jgi:hypothetical protein
MFRSSVDSDIRLPPAAPLVVGNAEKDRMGLPTLQVPETQRDDDDGDLTLFSSKGVVGNQQVPSSRLGQLGPQLFGLGTTGGDISSPNDVTAPGRRFTTNIAAPAPPATGNLFLRFTEEPRATNDPAVPPVRQDQGVAELVGSADLALAALTHISASMDVTLTGKEGLEDRSVARALFPTHLDNSSRGVPAAPGPLLNKAEMEDENATLDFDDYSFAPSPGKVTALPTDVARVPPQQPLPRTTSAPPSSGSEEVVVVPPRGPTATVEPHSVAETCDERVGQQQGLRQPPRYGDSLGEALPSVVHATPQLIVNNTLDCNQETLQSDGVPHQFEVHGAPGPQFNRKAPLPAPLPQSNSPSESFPVAYPKLPLFGSEQNQAIVIEETAPPHIPDLFEEMRDKKSNSTSRQGIAGDQDARDIPMPIPISLAVGTSLPYTLEIVSNSRPELAAGEKVVASEPVEKSALATPSKKQRLEETKPQRQPSALDAPGPLDRQSTAPAPPAPPPPPKSAGRASRGPVRKYFAVGDAVEARWGRGWCPATIKEVEMEGKLYKLVWKNGDSQIMEAKEIREVPVPVPAPPPAQATSMAPIEKVPPTADSGKEGSVRKAEPKLTTSAPSASSKKEKDASSAMKPQQTNTVQAAPPKLMSYAGAGPLVAALVQGQTPKPTKTPTEQLIPHPSSSKSTVTADSTSSRPTVRVGDSTSTKKGGSSAPVSSASTTVDRAAKTNPLDSTGDKSTSARATAVAKRAPILSGTQLLMEMEGEDADGNPLNGSPGGYGAEAAEGGSLWLPSTTAGSEAKVPHQLPPAIPFLLVDSQDELEKPEPIGGKGNGSSGPLKAHLLQGLTFIVTPSLTSSVGQSLSAAGAQTLSSFKPVSEQLSRSNMTQLFLICESDDQSLVVLLALAYRVPWIDAKVLLTSSRPGLDGNSIDVSKVIPLCEKASSIVVPQGKGVLDGWCFAMSAEQPREKAVLKAAGGEMVETYESADFLFSRDGSARIPTNLTTTLLLADLNWLSRVLWGRWPLPPAQNRRRAIAAGRLDPEALPMVREAVRGSHAASEPEPPLLKETANPEAGKRATNIPSLADFSRNTKSPQSMLPQTQQLTPVLPSLQLPALGLDDDEDDDDDDDDDDTTAKLVHDSTASRAAERQGEVHHSGNSAPELHGASSRKRHREDSVGRERHFSVRSQRSTRTQQPTPLGSPRDGHQNRSLEDWQGSHRSASNDVIPPAPQNATAAVALAGPSPHLMQGEAVPYSNMAQPKFSLRGHSHDDSFGPEPANLSDIRRSDSGDIRASTASFADAPWGRVSLCDDYYVLIPAMDSALGPTSASAGSAPESGLMNVALGCVRALKYLDSDRQPHHRLSTSTASTDHRLHRERVFVTVQLYDIGVALVQERPHGLLRQGNTVTLSHRYIDVPLSSLLPQPVYVVDEADRDHVYLRRSSTSIGGGAGGPSLTPGDRPMI